MACHTKPWRSMGRELVCPAGFEPATYGLEIRCSIQLSYGHVIYYLSIRQDRNLLKLCFLDAWNKDFAKLLGNCLKLFEGRRGYLLCL